MRSEAEMIGRIWKWLPSRPRNAAWLRLGVGDDAAVVRCGDDRTNSWKTGQPDWVLSCDQFLENVHFLAGTHSPQDVGYKALARATSDLAAMGAVPRFFMLSLGLPASRADSWLDGFLKGMARAAREFKMVVIGGDTSRFPSVAVNLTVGGQTVARSLRSGSARTSHLLMRSGARPGDSIYVSGTLGAAQLGLELVRRGLVQRKGSGLKPRDTRWKPFLETHLRPKIHLALGRWLAGENPWRLQIASAAIDTSDGLSTDLGHICESNRVGARIWAEKVPAVLVPEQLHRVGMDALKLALHGGEDYQLLFTVPRRAAKYLPNSFRGVRLTKIGEIVHRNRRSKRQHEKGYGRSSGKCAIELLDFNGRSSPLKTQGWDPFRNNP